MRLRRERSAPSHPTPVSNARPRPGLLPDPAAALEPPVITADGDLLVPADATAPTVATEPTIVAPGLAAWVRRHPSWVRRGAVASIATGVAVFTASAVASPLAGLPKLPIAALSAAPTSSYVPAPVAQLPPPLDPVTAPPTGSNHARTAPRRSTPAPSDPGAISGLAANGIPSVALNAYRVAAARLANVEPSCGIDWSLVAAIGRVESNHGTFGGAALHADGVSSPKIIGPALDGKHWDYIPAPGNGLQLDGDAVYAHALGPMQFIPSTWSVYGADANGDGRADIFNINDAALGTARYLCAAGGDLRGTAGQTRAVLAYNHNSTYLAQVLALADAYHRGLRVTGIPIVGITKGSLPTVVDTGYVPPANPGDPTAVDGSGKKKRPSTKAGKPKPGSTGSTSPRPKPGSSTAPAPTSTRTPAPTATTTTPAPGTSTTTAPPAGGTTTTPPPSSPTPTCPPWKQLLHQC